MESLPVDAFQERELIPAEAITALVMTTYQPVYGACGVLYLNEKTPISSRHLFGLQHATNPNIGGTQPNTGARDEALSGVSFIANS